MCVIDAVITKCSKYYLRKNSIASGYLVTTTGSNAITAATEKAATKYE